MRGFLFSALVLTIVLGSACGKSEKPAAETASTSAAPAPTPDPKPPIAILNTPGEGATVANKSWGTGWALF